MQPDNGIHRAGQFGIHLRLKGLHESYQRTPLLERVHVKTLHGTRPRKLYLFTAALEYFNCCQDLNPRLRKRQHLILHLIAGSPPCMVPGYGLW
jgi:hypothetical protein